MITAVGLLLTFLMLPSRATNSEKLKEKCLQAGTHWITQNRPKAQQDQKELIERCPTDLNKCPQDLRNRVFTHQRKEQTIVMGRLMLNLMHGIEVVRNIAEGFIVCGFGPHADAIREEAANLRYQIPTTIVYSTKVNTTDR